MAGTFAEGLAYGYAYGEPPDAYVDEIGADGGTLFLRDQSGIGRAAYHMSSNWRTAFSAPVFGAIRPTDRADLMRGIVSFLLDGTAVEERPGAADPALRVEPNPARAGAVVRIQPPAGVRTVTIHDPLGRVVTSPAVDAGGAAYWNGLGPDGKTAAGAYFIRATTNRGTLTSPLVVVR